MLEGMAMAAAPAIPAFIKSLLFILIELFVNRLGLYNLVVFNFFRVLLQSTIEGMAAECGLVTNQDELHACSCDSHVHAAEVAQKSHLPLIVASYQTDDDDVALLSLESVYRIDSDKVAERFPVGVSLNQLAQKADLSLVGTDGKLSFQL